MVSPTAAHRALASVTGPVGLALTNSTFTCSPAPVSLVPYCLPRRHHLLGDDALGARGHADVEESGPGDVDRRDPLDLEQPVLDLPGQVARVACPAFLASWSATLVA